MNRLRVYISGPLTSSGNVLENVEQATSIAQRLIAQGFAPLCPHLTHYIDPGNELPHDVWMSVDCPWVEAADAVYRFPGSSLGADIEVEHALKCDVPVFHSIEDLVKYDNSRRSRMYAENTPEARESELAKHLGKVPQVDGSGMVTYATGAVRSADREEYAYDLLPTVGIRRAAKASALGKAKYGDYNWEKGMSIRVLLNHLVAHIYDYLDGDRSEDHLGHAAWNALAACHSEERWPELNNDLRPVRNAKQEPPESQQPI